MNFLEKIGLVLMISAASVGPIGSTEAGLPAYIGFGIGWWLFLFGDALLTKRAADLCQTCGTKRYSSEDICRVCGTSR